MYFGNFSIIIVGLAAFLFSCKWFRAEVKYQDLTWSCQAANESEFDVTINDSFIHITSYEEDTLTRKLLKKDSLLSKITYWDNGIIVIDIDTNIINDTIIYEIVNVNGVNALLLKITKYEYWFSNSLPMEFSVSLALETDYNETLKATNFSPPYPEMIDGLRCGDSISWNDLEYFETFFRGYKLRRNPNIFINPSQGKFFSITQNNILISQVPGIVNDVSEKLGFNPIETRILDQLPSYEWEKGFLSVSLRQDHDYENGSGMKQSYSFKVHDAKPYAANKINPSSNESDRLQHLTKEKVREYLLKSYELNFLDAAIQTIDSAIKVDPSCYIAHFVKAEKKYKSGNTNGAKFDCIKAYQLNEYDQPTLALLLHLYLLENEYENARRLVREKKQLIDADSFSAFVLGDYFRVVENNMNQACQYYNLAFDRGHPNGLKMLQDYCY